MIYYINRAFCDSDCRNFECYRYFDGGVRRDLEKQKLPYELHDYSRSCEYYTKPIMREKNE